MSAKKYLFKNFEILKLIKIKRELIKTTNNDYSKFCK